MARFFPDFWAGCPRNPIFVIGYSRSGKSLLTGLLGLHRDVAYWQEANHVWDPRGYPWWSSGRETPPLWVDPVAYTLRWWRDTQPRQREIQAVFGAYQWIWRKPYFLNDNPFNTFRIAYLLAMFPQARFIHMVRDGREVAYWRACKQFEKVQVDPTLYESAGLPHTFEGLLMRLAALWRTTMQEVTRQDEALHLSRDGLILEVKYEEMCADTPAELERVCRFAGLDPSRFDPAIHGRKLQVLDCRWEEELDPALARQAITEMEPLLSQKGYL